MSTWQEDAVEHLCNEYPREGCGLVVSVDGVERYVPCHNLSERRDVNFVLDPRDYSDAEELGEIVALVHSHPDSPQRPSDADRRSCNGSGLTWHIVRVDGHPEDGPEARGWFTMQPGEAEVPLIGREFCYGTLDCYTLIQDWYRENMPEPLPDFDHGPNEWWDDPESSFNPYLDNIEAAGMEEVSTLAEPGDLIIMQIRSATHKPNHAGVYIGDGMMLHHLAGQLSTREVYGGYWSKVTRKFLRRKKA